MRKSKVLAFRHVPFEPLGSIASSLEEHGIAYDYVDLHEDPAADPPVEEAAGLIFMGGPMSVNDSLPYLRREMGYIAQAISRRTPVLGVCLGAQLIAKSLGAAVYPNSQKEIGWAPVHITQEARCDALLQGLHASETVFHWHGETFDLPADATLLASSDACRHQAFRVGASTYGLQFHLEVEPEMIEDWCRQDANCGDVRELDAPIDPRQNIERVRELARLVFGRWCELVTKF